MANHMNNDGNGFDVNRWAGTFRDDLDWWLNNSYGHHPTPQLPVVLAWRWAFFFSWPIWLDGPQFANTFGRLLKIRADITLLATQVITNLAALEKRVVPVAGSSPLMPYVGVHLRAANDTLAWWPSEESQIADYMRHLTALGMRNKTIYLASGSRSAFDEFSKVAKVDLQSVCTSKSLLLHGTELTKLQALTWDQQALIDYLVLLKSNYFLGMAQSSFSQNLASRRHLLKNGTDTLIWRGFQDEFSYLYGHRKNYQVSTV